MNPKYPTIFDNTMRCQFLECPRKLNWWWQGYDYEQIPPYFAFGQAWGIIKQAWYTSKGHKTDPKSPEWQALALDALAQGIHHWEDLGTEMQLSLMTQKPQPLFGTLISRFIPMKILK